MKGTLNNIEQIDWLTNTYAVVTVGRRTETVFKSVVTGRWVSSFNGMSMEFGAKEKAISYATGRDGKTAIN